METLTIAKLDDMAIKSGWIVTSVRAGMRHYRMPNGNRAWLNTKDQRMSFGFWLLNNSQNYANKET